MRSKKLYPRLINTRILATGCTRKMVVLLLLISVCSMRAFAQPYTAVALTGYNADVISNGTLPAASSVSLPSGYVAADGVGWNFVAQDYNYLGNIPVGTAYLPTGGFLPSASISGLSYQLASYSANNALFLPTTSSSGTLSFVTPQAGAIVYLLGTSGSGSSNFTATVNFADGSSQSFTGLVNNDWFAAIAGTGDFNNIGRVAVNSAGGGTANVAASGSGNPVLYKTPLTISAANATKLITGVTVTRVAGGAGYESVFAISMSIPPAFGASVASLPAFSTPACSNSAGQSFTISAVNVTGPGTFTATAPAGFQVSNDSLTWGSSTTISYSAPNLINAKVYVRFVSTSTAGASGNVTVSGGGFPSATVSVSGNSTALPAITGVANICPGATLTLADAAATAGGTWSSLNTGIATVVPGTGLVTAVSSGTATIMYTLPCGASTSTVLTVLNGPVPFAAANVCVGNTVALTDAVTGGSWTSGSTAVATIGSSSGIVSGLLAGVTQVTYTAPVTGCSVTAPVTVNANPVPFSVTQTGGSTFCAGSVNTNILVGTTGSTVGVNYQLYNGSTAVGSALAGTGSALNFGAPAAAGIYTVSAIAAATGCRTAMTGSASLATTPLPQVYTVSGSANFCVGATAVAHIMLSGSTPGFTYTLYNGTTTADVQTGTGSPLDFGSRTVAGVYTIVATNPTTGCVATMAGNATLSINPLPSVYTVTGGGSFCQGAPGQHVGTSYSNTGISYTLFRNGSLVTATLGTNAPIDFGVMTDTGTYTVLATNTTTGCTATLAGTAVVALKNTPASFSVTGGGNYCAGGTGVAIGVDGSETTAFYQAVNGATPVSGPLTGTGAAFNLSSSFTTPGTYIVVATSIISGCKDTMIGNVVVGTNPLPAVYTVSGGGSLCAGDAGVPVMLSNGDDGITYQLYYGATALGDSVSGAGGMLSFGNVATAGTYHVVAVDAATGCRSNMSGTATVTVNQLPNVYNVTGSGAYCSTDAGRSVGLNFSNTGITYLLFSGSTLVDSVFGTGAALSFGAQPGPSTYTAVAINTTTRCTVNMSGSAVVTITQAPTAYNVTSPGGYCAGTAGEHIGLDGADAGVTYQAYRSGVVASSAVTSTGTSAIDLGLFSTPGTYIIKGTASGCTTTMTGDAVVAVIPAPHAYALSGGTGICASGPGADLTLSGSAAGVNYQLFNGTTPVGSALPGMGGILDFGRQAMPGAYTVVATSVAAGCTATMYGTANVTLLPSPALHNVTGGGHYCAGGTGQTIGLDGSDAATHYQAFLGGAPLGAMATGAGAAINLGSFTAEGTYSIIATNPANGCSATMAGTATIVMDPLPMAETVTGGGAFCAGGPGADVALASSENAATYQLYRNGVATSLTPIAGTGSSIDFGAQIQPGVYTIRATSANGCTATMSGSAVATVSAPAVFTLSGSATFCQGSSLNHITLSGSEVGTTYQLNNGSAAAGAPVSGSGLPVDLGVPATSGNYTVLATNSLGCTATMAGTAAIVINALPVLHSVTGGGAYCASAGGVHIGLNSSNTGASYTLYNGSTVASAALAGTGSALDFGLISAAGNYKVIATNTGTGCTLNMQDTVAVTIKPSPVAYTLTADNNGNYCQGGAGVNLTLANSASGVSYQLYRYATPLTTSAGTGGALHFGPQTIAGPYIVIATNTVSGCSDTMNGTALVTMIDTPVAHNVSGGGGYCPAGEGQDVLLDGSNVGATYQLYNNGVSAGSPVRGTGIVIDFGNQLQGVYTVIGTTSVITASDTFTCSSSMHGSATVTLDTLLLPVVSIQAFPVGSNVSHIDSIKVVATNAGPLPTYQWYINGHTIPGATQSTYTAQQFFNGDSVACVVTSSGPCGGRSASNDVIISLSRVAVTQINAAGSDIKLIPNPNNGAFSLKGKLGTTTDEELSLEVTNMLGQVVYSNKVTTHGSNIDEHIALSNLANGMYIMNVRSANQNNVIHFVIEK